jgi:hypothetical protein
MTDPELLHILELAVALIMAILALWEKRQADNAEMETKEVVAFFDPGNDAVTIPPAKVLSSTWKMHGETKQYLCKGKTAQEKASLLQQIADAERKNLVDYTITGTTTYHHIQYGLVAGGNGEGTGG